MAIPLPRFTDRGAVVRRLVPVAIVGAVVGLGALTVLDVHERGDVVADAAAESQVWKIAGAPCPTLTTQRFRSRGLEAAKTFEFGGLTLSRRFGHAQCAEAPSGEMLGAGSYPVCQFTSPDVLVVQARDGVHLFEPGIGRKASVLVKGGKVSCIMAAPYWAT